MSRRGKNSLFARMMANGGFDDDGEGQGGAGSGSAKAKSKSKSSLKRTPSEERLYKSRQKDKESRGGLRRLKQQERAKREEEVKLAKMKGIDFKAETRSAVSYDESQAANEQSYDRDDPNTWSKTGGETCSCLYGNPCVDQYICLDWGNRFEVATKNGWKLAKK
jgi:hypothetical protein